MFPLYFYCPNYTVCLQIRPTVFTLYSTAPLSYTLTVSVNITFVWGTCQTSCFQYDLSSSALVTFTQYKKVNFTSNKFTTLTLWDRNTMIAVMSQALSLMKKRLCFLKFCDYFCKHFYSKHEAFASGSCRFRSAGGNKLCEYGGSISPSSGYMW